MVEFLIMSINKPIEQYIQSLSSPERNVRRKALIMLVEAGNIRVIPYLEKIAREDSDAELSFLAKKGLNLLKAKLEFAELRTPETKEAESQKTLTVLEALTSHLAHKSPEMRARVVRAAVATRDRQVLSVLIPHLDTETDDTVKGLILLAIAILSKAENVSIITKYLKDKSTIIKTAAIEALGSTSSPVAFPFILEGMNDKNKDVRSKSFTILIRLGKGNIIKLFETMLSSKNEWMNISALKAAAKFNSNEIIELVSKQLNGSKQYSELALKSLQILAKAGNKKAESIIENSGLLPSTEAQTQKPKDDTQASITKTDQTQQKESKEPKEESDDKTTEKQEGSAKDTEPTSDSLPISDAVPVSLDPNATDLTSSDPRKRQKFLTEVILHNDLSALDDIIAALDTEPDPKIKASMLITLGKLGSRDILNTLTPWLNCDEDRLRASAVEAVSQIKDIDLSQLLEPRLDDSDNRTLANAIVALIPYEDVDLMTPLSKLAASTRIRDRLSAIYAITHMGTDEAVKILKTLTGDPSKIVAKRATEAIEILDSRQNKPGAGKRQNPSVKKK